MSVSTSRNRSRTVRRVLATSRSSSLIDVDRVEAEIRGEESLVIDWRSARKRTNGYSARMMGYPETHLARAKAHVRTKDIGSHSKTHSRYGPGMSIRLIAPSAEAGIVKYYLAYGATMAGDVLGIPHALVSAIARRNGVQRTRSQASRFTSMGKSIVRYPSPARIRALNAVFLRDRHWYYRSRSAIDVRPKGFVDVPGYEGHYAVSSDGRAWAYPHQGKKRGHFLKIHRRPRTDPRHKDTFTCVLPVMKNYKLQMLSLSRLVATLFVPNPSGKPFVHFKNGVTDDCRSSNLEWMTAKELAAISHATMRREREILRSRGWAATGRTKPLPVKRSSLGLKFTRNTKKLMSDWGNGPNHPWNRSVRRAVAIRDARKTASSRGP